MGIRASAAVLYGIDFGEWMPSDALSAAAERKRSGVEFTYVSGEEAEPHCVLFARGSHTSLVYGYDVPVPVLDVATIGEGINAAILRTTLRAFCEKHGLPWQEPRWLIVSDVA